MKPGRRTIILAALFLTCAAGACGRSAAHASTADNHPATTNSGACGDPKPFSPQDAGLHAVILGEWGATVGKRLRTPCGHTRTATNAHRPTGAARSH
jgi:hypothetical protein